MSWLWETEVETNQTQGSVKTINVETLDFDTLWDNYPTDEVTHSVVDKNDIFENHCAINVSESLLQSKIAMKSFTGTRCWGACSTGHLKKHAIRAQELANWINLKPFAGCPDAEESTGATHEIAIQGKTGIIFFKDYWQRNGETGQIRTGDHIDLWNKNELASIGLIATWVRRNFPDFSSDYLSMSDLRNSTVVKFWEIN